MPAGFWRGVDSAIRNSRLSFARSSLIGPEKCLSGRGNSSLHPNFPGLVVAAILIYDRSLEDGEKERRESQSLHSAINDGDSRHERIRDDW